MQFCGCEILQFHQVSTPLVFSVLNLRDFGEARRVEHLVPNQIPITIEIC